MFSKLTADITGSADVCKIIPAEQFAQEVAMTYLVPGEKAYFLLKSKKEEHIFTNLAYICCKGESAANTRRLTTRYSWSSYLVSDVLFETAGIGITDRDCELKFSTNGHAHSIDIWKNETEQAKQVYKCIVVLSKAMSKNATLMALASEALVGNRNPAPMNDQGFVSMQWAEAVYAKYKVTDYEHVFTGFVKQ